VTTTVGIPVFNEASTLGTLLDRLVTDPGVAAIVVADDGSTDDSYAIASSFAERFDTVRVLWAPQRGGQLAAWRRAAEYARTSTLCFIDADALPAEGAIAKLDGALQRDPALVAASGRTVPDKASGAWPAARFRAELVHRVRKLQRSRDAIIGRFFAVRRTWFLTALERPDIIANDAYIGTSARRSGRSVRYVEDAVCYYGEARTTFDFAAQRQRADAGYAQLRALDLLSRADEPRLHEYVAIAIAASVHDPLGAFAWISQQTRARGVRAYRAHGSNAGAWEPQATTKCKLDLPLPPGHA